MSNVFLYLPAQYGENIVLLLQTVVMVSLLWKYSHGQVSFGEKTGVVALSVMYTTAALLFLPSAYRYLLHAFNDLIIIYSGGLQVAETFRIKHTGAQSIVSISMDFTGEAIRIFTTLEEAEGDLNMLLSFGLCATLSLTRFSQYWWYQKNTEQFYMKKQAEKNKVD